jgi:hypothetical protein
MDTLPKFILIVVVLFALLFIGVFILGSMTDSITDAYGSYDERFMVSNPNEDQYLYTYQHNLVNITVRYYNGTGWKTIDPSDWSYYPDSQGLIVVESDGL